MRIFNNWLYKVSALLIASVLWAAAQGIKSVEQSIDLPISLENTPPDVVVVGQSAGEVNMSLKGSRAAIRRAEKQLTRYPISLDGVKPGEARFSIEMEWLSDHVPRGAEVLARSPSNVVVRIDEKARKSVPVRIDLVGQPPDGYRLVEARVIPPEVLLEGAQTELRRVREVMTDRIDVSGLRATQRRAARPLLRANHVWRVDGETPVEVEIEVSAPPTPEGEDGAGAADTEPAAVEPEAEGEQTP